jgi:hypothetical protein
MIEDIRRGTKCLDKKVRQIAHRQKKKADTRYPGILYRAGIYGLLLADLRKYLIIMYVIIYLTSSSLDSNLVFNKLAQCLNKFKSFITLWSLS